MLKNHPNVLLTVYPLNVLNAPELTLTAFLTPAREQRINCRPGQPSDMEIEQYITRDETELSPAVVVTTILLIAVFAVGLLVLLVGSVL